jgi:hypothetical protein
MMNFLLELCKYGILVYGELFLDCVDGSLDVLSWTIKIVEDGFNFGQLLLDVFPHLVELMFEVVMARQPEPYLLGHLAKGLFYYVLHLASGIFQLFERVVEVLILS